ncbi:hypothetical protein [Novosphingobium sp. PC22D]|uniref:hypothetical protein n=1 Tax=Novosphingobium sp. PC22D TaxID=1962403 RepID=UPI00114550D4|nr:hypothetical protein [Novosphingobium sp. PC22D]
MASRIKVDHMRFIITDKEKIIAMTRSISKVTSAALASVLAMSAFVVTTSTPPAPAQLVLAASATAAAKAG